MTTIEALLKARGALSNLMLEPGGCSLCDSGVPRNHFKGHQPDCSYVRAVEALDAADAALEAADKAEPPDGWQLVPKVPTQAMLKAVRFGPTAPITAGRWGSDHVRTIDEDGYNAMHWAAMLRAEAQAALAAVAEAEPSIVIAEMVNRFLWWPLPKTFSPDCGIAFDGRKDDEWNKNKTWPVGTNLLTAFEAKAMFEHVLATPQAAKESPPCTP